jgi:hypothetical protein
MKRNGHKEPKAQSKTPVAAAPAKHTFYVVGVEAARQFHGIICPLDLYKIHVLVEGGTQPLQESYSGSSESALAWYKAHLESQGIVFTKTKTLTTGHNQGPAHVLWVDLEATPLDSYAHVRTLADDERTDPSILAWKTYYMPCTAGTKKEALGFWVCAASERLGPKTCAELFTEVIGLEVK